MIKKFIKNSFIANADIWDLAIKSCLYGLVFLIPVFFLPWTFYQVAWNKQFVLALLTFLALIAWLIKGIVRGEITYVKSRANILLSALLMAIFLSALFSGSRALGFLGMTGAEMSFLTMFSLAVVFWLAGFVGSMGLTRPIIIIGFISSVLVVLISWLQMLGVWLFPWDFTRSINFNTIGTNNAAVLFFGFLFVTSFTAIYFKKIEPPARFLLWPMAVLSFLLISGMGFWSVFLGVGLMMGVIVALDLLANRGRPAKLIILPAIILAVCLFFAVNNFFAVLKPTFLPSFKLPAEVMPSLSASWNIARSTLKESWGSFLFGSGPGTFQYQYGLYRDANLNATDFWGVRFAYGFNALSTHLADWGLLGMVALLFFLLSIIWEAIRKIRQQPAISLGFLFLVISLALYPQNIVMYFLLFLMAGLLIDTSDRRKIVLTGAPVKTFAVSLLLIFLIMLSVSVLYVQAQRYVGSVYFNNALNYYEQTGNVDEALAKLTKSFDLDPRNDLYLQNITQARLLKLNNLMNNSQLPLSESQAQFSSNLEAAIQSARKATEINGRDSQNWVGLGKVYQNVILLVSGAIESAIGAFQQAQKLEPNNPVISMELGKSRLLGGDFLAKNDDRVGGEKEYEAAIVDLEKSISQKPDYAPARFLLVEVLDRQGKVEEMVGQIENLKSLAPNDVNLLFQLGLLHYRSGRYDYAKKEFEAAIQLFPNYSNARYFLGLVYDREGKVQKAIAQFEAISELNPDNEEVKNILKNLKQRKPAVKDYSLSALGIRELNWGSGWEAGLGPSFSR